MLKRIEVFNENSFDEKKVSNLLVHDSPYMKVINFNFKAGQELPVHSHDIEGQLSIVVLEGSGEFLGKDDFITVITKIIQITVQDKAMRCR